MKTYKGLSNKPRYTNIQSQLSQALDIVRSNISTSEYHFILFLLLLKRDELIGRLFTDVDFNHHPQTTFGYWLKRNVGWWSPIYGVYEPIVSKFNISEFVALLHVLNSIDQSALKDHFAELFDDLLYRLSDIQGRESGEYVLPQEFGRLVGKIVNVSENAKIYNPFAGLASFGVFSQTFGEYYGQERNLNAWSIGQLRLIAHNRDKRSIYSNGDSVLDWNPSGHKFDLIISNPPFGLRLSKDLSEQFQRFRTLEQFFIERGIEDLKYNGKIIGVISKGFLSRLGAEERLRKLIVDEDILDTIITFPRGVLLNTSIPIAIIIIDKDKKRKGFFRFVDAKDYVKSTASREKTIVTDELRKLLNDDMESEYVSVVTKREIKGFGYNLDVSRYFSLKAHASEKGNRVRLGEIVQLIKGDKTQGHVLGKFVRIRDLKDDKLQFNLQLDQIENNEVPKTAKKISESCLLLAIRWKSLKPTYFRHEGESIYIIPDTIPFKIDESKIDIEYLVNEIHTDSFKNIINSYRVGDVIPYIRVEDILKATITLPTIEEQRAKVLGIKETLIKEKEKEVELFKKINGLENDITEQNTHLRHALAGPSSNLKGAFSNLRDILLNKVQPEFPGLLDLKVSEGHDLTIGGYLEIIGRDINKITDAVSRRLKVDTSIESKMLSKLEIVAFVQNYIREYKEKKDLNFEIKFDIDEEAFLDSEGELIETYIMGNSELLSDLLTNLIDNAVAHAFHPSWKNRIEIFLMRDNEIDKPNEVQILFSNTGKPFPENIRYSDFIKKGTKAGINAGDGYGGWYINEIVKKHKGTLDIIDETGPEGLTDTDLATSFEINFPIYENGY